MQLYRLRLKFVLRALVLGLLSLTSHVTAQTNTPLEIITPQDGERFNPRTNIVLSAVINQETNVVKRVEFLANDRLVATLSNTPYSTIWSNVPAGSYTLKARAVTDAAPIESALVEIRVYNAMLTFGLHHIRFLDTHKPFGIPLWQYCASFIYIFLAFYVSKITDFLTRKWLKRWAEKTETKFDDLLLQLLNGPIKIITFVIFLRIGVEVFSWPAMIQIVLTKGFIIVIASTVTYTVMKFIDLLLGYWRHRAKADDPEFDKHLLPIIRKTLKVFVGIVAALVTLANVGVDINAALASLSIGGLALGLAAQDTLANLFGAVSVFVDKPFRIGDRIQLTGVDGTVEAIGLRSTRVRSLEGYLISIPNKTMGNSTVTNITERPNIKTEMNFGLTYDTSAEKVKRAVTILNEIYGSHPQTFNLAIGFNKFVDSALNINVVHWWKGTNGKAYLAGIQELNLKVKERFDAEGLDFAYPSQTVYLKQDSDDRESQTQPTAK